MLTPDWLEEWRASWLPNITTRGLARLLELLERASPLLVSGCFTRAVPMGCLATHVAWHHPQTAHLTIDAGITWLHQVAHLNPATSRVLCSWDELGPNDFTLRGELIAELRRELQARRSGPGERRRPRPAPLA